MPNWEEIQREWETTKITLAALAEKHDVKLGTLKSRKSREAWVRGPSKKDATIQRDATNKIEKVASVDDAQDTPRRRGAPKGNANGVGNRGNTNASPPRRNSNGLKHGFFSKFLPAETLEIMEQMQERSSADLIYDQIQIQYAAIIRAQQIMFVEDRKDITRVLKKEKPGAFGDEQEWEIQFAWDKHATFMNAQSRAMGELRSLIKQFCELAHDDDERRLKLEQMQVGIARTKAEVHKITNENKQVAPPTITIVDAWSDGNE